MARGDQQTKQTKSEESQSSVTVERGEQSKFESEEDRGGERQVGESQSYHGLWSRRSCDARNNVPACLAANGEQIKDLGEKNIPFKTNEGIQRCITFRSANVVKPLISMQKVVRAGNIVVLDEMNPHIRNTRDGTVIKLDVNNGVYTMDMWICLDETGPVFSWQGQ